MTSERSSVRPPEVVMRLVTVYDWPPTPPASQMVARVVVFESSAVPKAAIAEWLKNAGGQLKAVV